MIKYEKDILLHLDIPSIPLKKWDGKSSFKRGVAVLTLFDETQAFAVATFDADTDNAPRVIKVFSLEPYKSFEVTRVVPDYMDIESVDSWDVPEQSKRAAKVIADEVRELQEENVTHTTMPENEYCFDFIHTDEEAQAYLRSWNKRNGLKRNRVPSSHDEIIARLTTIWMDEQRKK